MNEDNCKVVLNRIREAADNLKGKLPETSKHPNGRNPYAHIPKVIKSVFGKSYKELPDEDLEMIMEVIDYCERYPF